MITRKKNRIKPATDLAAVAARGNLNKVIKMLEQGADPNEVGKSGKTPVQEALINQDMEMVAILIECGALET